MYFDRLDIVEAYYCFFMHYHEGQGSIKYERLCNMSKYFKPGLNVYSNLSDNAKEIYNNLAQKCNEVWKKFEESKDRSTK